MKVLNGGIEKKSQQEDHYKNLISQHFQFIEKQCFKAVKLKLGDTPSEENALNVENEALELSAMVLDTLQKNDYRTLKDFKGNSLITTYLTAIISRHAVDMIRKKRGRGRQKERAKEFGDTGLLVYQRVIKNGYPLRDVFDELQGKGDFSGSLQELETIVHKIKGNNPRRIAPNGTNGNGSVVKRGTTVGTDEKEIIIPDTKNNPGELLVENQRKQKIQQAVGAIIARLTGEERLLLRMRFPAAEDEKPKSVEQVSKVLGISQKAVYKRIIRLLKKCKEHLYREGVTVDELF